MNQMIITMTVGDVDDGCCEDVNDASDDDGDEVGISEASSDDMDVVADAGLFACSMRK